jgi:hypothetical protein
MNCPGKIVLTIENIEEKKVVRNLVCYIEILVKKKNNYTLGPFFTDESGKIILTKKIILDTITGWMNEYPMDYASDLSDCGDEIIVKIYQIEKLKERVAILEKFYPDEAKKLRVLLGRAQNNLLTADFQKTYKISESIKVSIPSSVDKSNVRSCCKTA